MTLVTVLVYNYSSIKLFKIWAHNFFMFLINSEKQKGDCIERYSWIVKGFVAESHSA